jgi:hypothetical protein
MDGWHYLDEDFDVGAIFLNGQKIYHIPGKNDFFFPHELQSKIEKWINESKIDMYFNNFYCINKPERGFGPKPEMEIL